MLAGKIAVETTTKLDSIEQFLLQFSLILQAFSDVGLNPSPFLRQLQWGSLD